MSQDKMPYFTNRLRDVFHPADLPNFERWLPMYKKLYEVVRDICPERIVEIGCRRGYSAWTMFQASPFAHILSIDLDGDERTENTHGGERGSWRHAEQIMVAADWHLMLVDSRDIKGLPRCDLVYVDGDHTEAGCFADLELADMSGDVILVDDYDTEFDGGMQFVRMAVDRFIEENDYTSVYHDNGLTGLMVIDKRDRW